MDLVRFLLRPGYYHQNPPAPPVLEKKIKKHLRICVWDPEDKINTTVSHYWHTLLLFVCLPTQLDSTYQLHRYVLLRLICVSWFSSKIRKAYILDLMVSLRWVWRNTSRWSSSNTWFTKGCHGKKIKGCTRILHIMFLAFLGLGFGKYIS